MLGINEKLRTPAQQHCRLWRWTLPAAGDHSGNNESASAQGFACRPASSRKPGAFAKAKVTRSFNPCSREQPELAEPLPSARRRDRAGGCSASRAFGSAAPFLGPDPARTDSSFCSFLPCISLSSFYIDVKRRTGLKNTAGFYKACYNRAAFHHTFLNDTWESQELCKTLTDSIYRHSCSGTINAIKSRPSGNRTDCHRDQMGIFPLCTRGVAQQTRLHYQLLRWFLPRVQLSVPAPEKLFLTSTANNFGLIRQAVRSLHTGSAFFISPIYSPGKNNKYVPAAEMLMQRVFYWNKTNPKQKSKLIKQINEPPSHNNPTPKFLLLGRTGLQIKLYD